MKLKIDRNGIAKPNKMTTKTKNRQKESGSFVCAESAAIEICDSKLMVELIVAKRSWQSTTLSEKLVEKSLAQGRSGRFFASEVLSCEEC